MRIKHFLFSAFLFFLSACELQALPGIKLNCDPKTDASCGGEVTKTPPDDGGDDGGDGEVDPPPSVDPVPPKVDLSDCYLAPDGGPFVTWWDSYKKSYGYDFIRIAPNEIRTYCFNIPNGKPSFRIMLIDRSGSAQCFSHRAILTPPPGSGLRVGTTDSGVPPGGWWTSPLDGWCAASTTTWAVKNGVIPGGVYKVKMQFNGTLDPSCGVFQLYGF